MDADVLEDVAEVAQLLAAGRDATLRRLMPDYEHEAELEALLQA
ncbi:MAG TPA: hypothetical protein VK955_01155 [Xanthobacteraceae bacterium]|nr:hypothetical protein [Xanthobacteraceae bacterium]